ncbi:hypothetical protein G4B88_027441 [Cannabis sativa]|uniref:Reverse transcriptase zinc-binding domain-containing protein n=1 Tax=Cannabis sativa TaxID=3483 RepID=A0A7J6HS50_CANSA|nr:hypothetical protein G4B88_027441 [Cannabis sativa]
MLMTVCGIMLFNNEEQKWYASTIWKRYSVPKHRYIVWLAAWISRLKKKDRLLRQEIQIDNQCLIFGLEVESHDHSCVYNMKGFHEILVWVGFGIYQSKFKSVLNWIRMC